MKDFYQLIPFIYTYMLVCQDLFDSLFISNNIKADRNDPEEGLWLVKVEQFSSELIVYIHLFLKCTNLNRKNPQKFDKNKKLQFSEHQKTAY